MTHPAGPRAKLHRFNTAFLTVAHVLAVGAVAWLVFVHFSWWTVGLGVLWFALCGLAITGGYHRLFSHKSYEASPILRALYLFFGAAAAQNSALVWSADHRRHHAYTDESRDPYNIRKGFIWAHIGWIFFRDEERDLSLANDLADDPLVAFQDRHYILLAILGAAVLPAALGLLWGDPIGALLVAAFLRLAAQWHSTFSVNSLTHTIGRRPYSVAVSARDSFLTALVTLGEGYHNFHHRFQRDYRNGVRWYHFDPTKWAVWSFARVGLARDLRRTPKERILKARESVREACLAAVQLAAKAGPGRTKSASPYASA